jgi:hypothetical protein
MSELITIDRGYFAEQLDVATKVERQRIIELLITSQEVTHDNIWKWSGSEYTINLGNLITLIREGNK